MCDRDCQFSDCSQPANMSQVGLRFAQRDLLLMQLSLRPFAFAVFLSELAIRFSHFVPQRTDDQCNRYKSKKCGNIFRPSHSQAENRLRKEVVQTERGDHRAKERHKEATLQRYDNNSKQTEKGNNPQPSVQLKANKN